MIDSLILRTATRLLVPLILLFSVFLLVTGHHQPGGGFSGGLVAALAFVLYAFAFGTTEAERALPVDHRKLVGAGLATALAAGVIDVIFGDGFLAGSWVDRPFWEDVPLELGTPFLFDIGIFLIVAGMVLSIAFALEKAFTSISPDQTREDL